MPKEDSSTVWKAGVNSVWQHWRICMYMYVYIYDCRDKTLTERFADISFVYQVFHAMIRMRYQWQWNDCSSYHSVDVSVLFSRTKTRRRTQIITSHIYCADYNVFVYIHCNFICGLSDVILKTVSRVSQSTSVNMLQSHKHWDTYLL